MSYITKDTQPANVSPGCYENENGMPKGISPVINPEVHSIINAALAQPTEAELQAKSEAEEQQAADEAMNQEIDKCIVDMGEVIDEGVPAIAITDPETGRDVAICRNEDLITVKAGPKNGKSTLMSIFIAALLCGQWGRVKSFFQNPRILYIDTEMKKFDTQRMGRMALKMAGMPESVNPPNFVFINLRKYGPDEIVPIVEALIKRFTPDFVFIDGSLDLVNNFNDNDESNALVKQKYLAWMSTYKCNIITAVHTNKTNDTHQSQGHLGAMLDKKGEITIECQRDKENHIITVSAPTCRHTDMPEFSFKYGKDGLPVSCDDTVAELKAQKLADKELKNLLKKQAEYDNLLSQTRDIMKDVGTAGISQSDLASRLMSRLDLKISSVQAKIKLMVDRGDLSKDGYNGNLVLRQSTDISES